MRFWIIARVKLPISKEALLIRTDFSDSDAWRKLKSVATNPGEPFNFFMQIVDDTAFSCATASTLQDALPKTYPHSYFMIADEQSFSQPDYPILVVDLQEQPGRAFRAAASEIASIDNNLSIGNMGLEEFADASDRNGIFRGFPQP